MLCRRCGPFSGAPVRNVIPFVPTHGLRGTKLVSVYGDNIDCLFTLIAFFFFCSCYFLPGVSAEMDKIPNIECNLCGYSTTGTRFSFSLLHVEEKGAHANLLGWNILLPIAVIHPKLHLRQPDALIPSLNLGDRDIRNGPFSLSPFACVLIVHFVRGFLFSCISCFLIPLPRSTPSLS